MAIVMNLRSHAVPLTVGLLGPRETRNVDTDLPLEAALVAEGTLTIVDSMVSPPSPPTPPGSFKGTASTQSALPAIGNNDGDVRVTVDDYVMYAWHAEDAEWRPVSGQGGSGSLIVTEPGDPGPEPTLLTDGTVWIEVREGV